MTRIEKLCAKGIRRIGSPARGFRYLNAEGRKITRAELSRVEALKIPPAWTDVCINSTASGAVQAMGKDVAGRWQYIYHDSHVRRRERKKFQRLIDFAEKLPAMRKAVAKDLRQSGYPRERVMASILRILSLSFIRPGSEVYANENGSYGLATLRPKHVKVKGDLVIFDFPGKSAVRQRREFRDRTTARIVRERHQCLHPGSYGWEFQRQRFPHLGRDSDLRLCAGACPVRPQRKPTGQQATFGGSSQRNRGGSW